MGGHKPDCAQAANTLKAELLVAALMHGCEIELLAVLSFNYTHLLQLCKSELSRL